MPDQSGPGPKAPFSVLGVLVLGLVFHLVFINSVFDCYFTSPVVHGMQHFRAPAAEAKRLVLIVGDGLRADLLFARHAFANVTPDAPEFIAPFLRSITLEKGAFGVSHTRVPTESRPGHVALIGGMYEDVSAVTKGWKHNPVDFDSVFNQSSHTFSFGSPDILPMFASGATPGKVDTFMYNEEDEDFTKDATDLDTWVMAQLRTLIANASVDADLDKQLRQDKVVFFLHLLGLDTTGHSYRPHSVEYMNNIRVVDQIGQETEALMSSFYGDAETAFVFTADHGMSIIGNHGDGHPDNTRTPLIAWGKGVRGPIPDSAQSSHDVYSRSWDLGHLYRRDVEQADVAALMAALIGVDWPVNSVGVLPDVDGTKPGYLSWADGQPRKTAEAALVNGKVLIEHYRVKHNLKRSQVWRYKPYARLSSEAATGLPGAGQLVSIENLIVEAKYELALERSSELIQDALQGLRYLETYDRTLIRTLVLVAYTGWMAYTASALLAPAASTGSIWLQSPITTATLLSLWTFFARQHSPWSFYIYGAFPVYFWHHASARFWPLMAATVHRQQANGLDIWRWVVRGASVLAAMLSMVFGYQHRSIWSAGFVAIGVFWPAISWPRSMFTSQCWPLSVSWTLACLVSAVFPLLSVDKEESIALVTIGAISMVVLAIVFTIVCGRRNEAYGGPALAFTRAQIALILPTVMVTAAAAHQLSAKVGLPPFLQVSGWILLIISLSLPFVRVQHPHYLSKLLSLCLTFCPVFVILSISTEGLFYAAYCSVLVLWVAVEAAVRESDAQQDQERKDWRHDVYRPRADDMRIALFFLFLVQVGFFGTGNVASISSFYLAPVYRLVPTFKPFIMAALLMLKILAPYVPLSACFAALHARLRLPPFALFLVSLTLTDVMTVYFFFNVRDEGSWLEIGQSISFFCITSLLCVFACGVCAAGEWLVGDMMRTGQREKSVNETASVAGQ